MGGSLSKGVVYLHMQQYHIAASFESTFCCIRRIKRLVQLGHDQINVSMKRRILLLVTGGFVVTAGICMCHDYVMLHMQAFSLSLVLR